MKLSLLMLLRNLFLPSLCLLLLVTKWEIVKRRKLVAGKDKDNGNRTGEKPTRGKGSLHFLSSI